MREEHRRFTRIPFKTRAEMIVHDHVYEAEEIINLGVGGALLPISAEFDPGTVCRLRILLSGTSSELIIRTDGEIVRSEGDTVAVKFTGIDPDSLFHLQNILRYNAPDAESIEREIEAHPGLL